MSGCLSSPDSIIEWVPRKWNTPSDTIQAVRGSLQLGERRGREACEVDREVEDGKFIQSDHFQCITHRKTFGSRVQPGPDGRSISTDLAALGGRFAARVGKIVISVLLHALLLTTTDT